MEHFLFLFMITLSGASPIMKASSNRISNGILAEENQFPYMMSLQQISQVTQSFTKGHRCGGALISLRHGLTAASCTYNNNNGVISAINPAEYRVFAGSVVLTNDTSPDRIRNVAFISVHPGFEMNRPYVNDIAVITLVSPFLGTVVQILGLWAAPTDPFSITEVCTVAGWGGVSESASASARLFYLNKSIFNRESCATLYNNQLTIDRNMICATSGRQDSSSCTGDIGNPLVCFDSSSNRYSITGILTVTKECRASDMPEVYSRVQTYYQWIHLAMTYTAPEGTTPIPGGGASSIQPVFAMLIIFALIQIHH